MGDTFNIPDIPENEKIQLYNACGQGLYVGREPTTMELMDPICQPCPENINDNSPLVDMCSNDSSIWLPAQQDANPSNRLITQNLWTDINTVLIKGPGDNINQINSVENTIRDWYLERMPDKAILEYMNNKGYFNEIENETERLNRFKEEVSGTRGSLIFCKEPSGVNNSINSINGEEIINLGENWNPNEIIDEENNIKLWDGCDSTGMYGPKNIIMEEIQDWEIKQDLNNQDTARDNTSGNTTATITEETTYGDITKGIMGMELFPPNREFEDCINELLNEYDDYNDNKIIGEIRSIHNILQLETRHIQFIKKKLELLIISSSKIKVKQCILDNLVLEDICEMSLSYKMLVVLNILFSIIGFNLELSKVNSDDPNIRKKLIMLIDEMGDLIPRSLDRIIEISEEIEMNKCGKVSGRTQLLKELQTVMFNPPKKIINLDLPNFKSIISEENMSDNEFNRFAVLAGIGLAILKFI
jgi:hypothetical protein